MNKTTMRGAMLGLLAVTALVQACGGGYYGRRGYYYQPQPTVYVQPRPAVYVQPQPTVYVQPPSQPVVYVR